VHRRACFGFEVSSDQPLHYLRRGSGSRQLQLAWGRGEPPDVEGAPLLAWDAPRFPFAARLHRLGGRFHLWIDRSGWFTIDPERSWIGTPADAPALRTQERIWGIPAMLCLLHRGLLPLHAAAVEIDGRAVVFGAPGRHGKTTLAAACAVAGLRVLAEDLAVLDLNGTPSLLPGPAMLRLRHDVVAHLGRLPGTVLGREDDRVHVALDDVGTGAPVPISAVILLREGDTAPSLRSADQRLALRDLWALSFNLPTAEDRSRCFSKLVDLLAVCPVLDLTRRRSYGELSATVSSLAAVTVP
jgi:hypothetical protein